MSVESPSVLVQAREPHHVVIAVTALLMVFAGFAPTFYLNAFFEQRNLDALRIVHGVVFSLWPVLLMTQVMLAKVRRPQVHRRLGLAGVAVAAAMVLSGTTLAIQAARFGFATPGLPPPAAFLAIPLFDMVMFAALVTAAVVLRRRRDDHARLMILATLAILPAAFGRLPLPGLDDPILKGWLPTFALLLAPAWCATCGSATASIARGSGADCCSSCRYRCAWV